MPPGAASAAQQAYQAYDQRLARLARVYQEGILLNFDAEANAVDITFIACPMHTPAEVELAFQILLAKVRALLAPLGRARSALLVDIAGLDIGTDVTPVWGKSLGGFLGVACEELSPGRYLIARYNSRLPSNGNRQETIKRIQIITSAVAEGFQSNILGSREEAAALLLRLRELAGRPADW